MVVGFFLALGGYIYAAETATPVDSVSDDEIISLARAEHDRPSDRNYIEGKIRSLLKSKSEEARGVVAWYIIDRSDLFAPSTLDELIGILLRDGNADVRKGILLSLADLPGLVNMENEGRVNEIAAKSSGEEQQRAWALLRAMEEYKVTCWAVERLRDWKGDPSPCPEVPFFDSKRPPRDVPKEIRDAFSFLDENPVDKKAISKRFTEMAQSDDEARKSRIPVVLTTFREFVTEADYEDIIGILLNDSSMEVRAEMLVYISYEPCNMGKNRARVEEIAKTSNGMDGEQARNALEQLKYRECRPSEAEEKKSDQPQPASK